VGSEPLARLSVFMFSLSGNKCKKKLQKKIVLRGNMFKGKYSEQNFNVAAA